MVKKTAKKQSPTVIKRRFRRQWGKRFRSKPPVKGFKEWARNPATDQKGRHTFYVTVEVEVGQSGTPPFAEPGTIVPVTLALLKRQKTGRLTPLTYQYLAAHFDELVNQALMRANFSLARELPRSVRAIFRHKDK